MANNIIAQVAGGDKKILEDVETVADVRSKLGIGSEYTAAVNGRPADNSDSLEEGNRVTFAQSVKGGI